MRTRWSIPRSREDQDQDDDDDERSEPDVHDASYGGSVSRTTPGEPQITPASVSTRAASPTSLWRRPTRGRLYASARNAPRARRPTDLLLLITTLLLIAGLVVLARPPSNFEQALMDLAASIPGYLDVLWRIL